MLPQKDELVKVNLRLSKKDVERAKYLAQKDLRSYHAILREAVSRGLKDARVE